jgi:hypothetical protein
MKRMGQIIARGGILLVATLVVLILSWIAFSMVTNGISDKLMGFEQEPAQGWNYWWWFYFKRSLWGILGTAAILLALAGLVAWGWVAFVRDVRRNRQC